MSVQEAVDGLGQLINGEIVTNGDTFPVENPSTGEVIAQCPAASVDMVDQAMAAAAAAGPGWAATPEAERREVIRQMCRGDRRRLPGHRRSRVGWRRATRAPAARRGTRRCSASTSPTSRCPSTSSKTPTTARSRSCARRSAWSRAIAPWNAPVLILAEKIFTALLVGNTVVAKPSPFTPLGTLMVAKLWKDIVPPGVVNILAGDDELGPGDGHRTRRPRMISFTGSRRRRARRSRPPPRPTSRTCCSSSAATTPPSCSTTST